MMIQEKRFYIPGSADVRPSSKSTLYVDGTADAKFRTDVDIELSHWLPNQTEDCYKAGTSTEICFKFLEKNKAYPYDLVINTHLDIDGLLSVFVLAYPTFALQHKTLLCAASRTGDFWAWSEGKSLKLFQELTLLYQSLEKQKLDLQKAYQQCFNLVIQILKNQEDKVDIQSILENQFSLVAKGIIKRQEWSSRFVSYFIPYGVFEESSEGALSIPYFNEPLSDKALFWPQVRNYFDSEKVQLVAMESLHGIHYDLWYPGYIWADTQGLWRPPGLIPPIKTEEMHLIALPALSRTIARFNEMERGSCEWKLFPGVGLFDKNNPRRFPVVASTFTANNRTKRSGLSLESVCDSLSPVWGSK